MRIKLQNIIIPNEPKGKKEPLYCIKNRDTISYATYFNCLSIVKWKKYTEVNNIKIHFLVVGRCELKVKNYCKSNTIDNAIHTSTLCIQTVDNADSSWVEIEIPEKVNYGIIGFEIKSPSENFRIIDGFYDAEIPDDAYQEVNLALNICTFKRENYILTNLNIIYKEILNNSKSEIRDHVAVYVQDNGRTLDVASFNNDRIHIVSNKNYGGVAGFTRGMIEIMHHIDLFPATHIIMMDDDIEINTESIFRTYRILTCRRKEYQDLTIGGAMLKIGDPTLMVENGSTWDSNKIIPNNYELRIDSIAACVECEIEGKANYNAWWYCCIPMSFVRDYNLPIPIFMQADDIEYGIRNIGPLLVINGICVWHQAFEDKYASPIFYYKHRNMLIVNALHFKNYNYYNFARDTLVRVLEQLYAFRYNNAFLIIKATEDFLKGIDFIKYNDAEQLNNEIISLSDKLVSLSDIRDYDTSNFRKRNEKYTKPKGRLRRLACYFTINGTLLPKIDRLEKEICMQDIFCYNILDMYREKKVLYCAESTNQGFVVECDKKVAVGILIDTISLLARASSRFSKVCNEYRTRISEVTTEEYWAKYLHIRSQRMNRE